MLSLEFDITPDRHQAFNGLEIAEGLIGAAIRYLIPYAQGCHGCVDEIFSVLANQQLANAHAEDLRTGRFLALGEDEKAQHQAFEAHLAEMEKTVRQLIELHRTHRTLADKEQ